jgi:hypothetical protein
MPETHFVTFDSVPLNSVTRNCVDGSSGANKSAGALTFIQFRARLLSKNCIDLHKWLLGTKYSITFQLVPGCLEYHQGRKEGSCQNSP